MNHNTKPPALTVIMAAYNAEDYISDAISSILHQTYRDFEFIIIDDGSTDNTHSLISSYDDERIILLTNETNRGLAYSLNRGIHIARSNYIIRMDADDISYPDRFEKLFAEATRFPEYGIICSQALIINEADEMRRISSFLKNPEEIYVYLQFANCLIHSSVMIRKDILDTYGAYNEKYRYGQDFELWNRLSKKTRIYQINEPLLEWRAPEGNVLEKKQKQWAEADIMVFDASCDFFFNKKNNLYVKKIFQSMKKIIGPNPIEIKIPLIIFSVLPVFLGVLTRKISKKTPDNLNKQKVVHYLNRWMIIFMVKWVNKLLTFGRKKFIG